MTGLTIAEAPPTRPYLVRALYEWCTDNGFTPYVAVYVDDTVQVPREFVKNNEIVLNISMDATSGLKLGNDFIEFKARFGGVARAIMVPLDRVLAIYARENGQGMAFPVPAQHASIGPGQGDSGSGHSAGLSAVPSPLLDTLPNETNAGAGVPPSLAIATSLAPQPEPAATPGPAGTSDAQIIPLGAGMGTPGDGSQEPPHPPKTPAGARPALKRVK
jgi:stringent starvation protein B